MPLQITTLPRVFFINERRIPDPLPSASLSQVQQYLATAYPDVANATAKGPDITNGEERYTFNTVSAIGIKG